MYFNRGFYWFVRPDKTWIKLGKTETESLKAYAELLAEPSGFTMSHLFDRYIKNEIPKKAERTQFNNLREIELLRNVFGKMKPSQVKKKHIAQYLDLKGNVAANREIALLSHVFKKAIRWGMLELNPCTDVERNKENRNEKLYITDEQYQAIYSIAPDRIQIAMELARITGLRQGDLLRLTWDNITEKGLLVKMGKTGKSLLFEITPQLAALLDRCAAIGDDFLLGKYSSSGFQTAWQRLIKGQPMRFKFMDLRAKAASETNNATELLGHADSRVTEKHYKRLPRKVRPN